MDKTESKICICEAVDHIVRFDAETKRIQEFVKSQDGEGQSADYRVKERGANPDRVGVNIFVGVKSEFLAKTHLEKTCGFPSIDIDTEVRKGSKKEWRIDLPYGRIDDKFPNVHVKSCDQWGVDFAGDYSWLFNLSNDNGVGGRDTIFEGPDSDLVAFVFLRTPESSEGTIKAIMPWGKIKGLLREPKANKFKNTKRAIYLNDIKEYIDEEAGWIRV